MRDKTAAEAARLMNVINAIVHELHRQGLVEAMTSLGFDPTPVAKAAIRAADGDIVPFKRP
jgi:hypothetical protein